jgi:hypothetical protein
LDWEEYVFYLLEFSTISAVHIDDNVAVLCQVPSRVECSESEKNSTKQSSITVTEYLPFFFPALGYVPGKL